MGWLQDFASKFRGGSAKSEPPGPTPREQWQVTEIYFDSSGWALTENTPDKMAWTHANGAQLTLSKTSRPAGDVASASLAELRQHWRARAVAKDESLVSAEPGASNSVPSVEVITKYKHGLGFGFIGRLEVSTEAHEYLMSVSVDEGQTGGREAIVNMQRLAIGEISIDALMTGGKGPVPIPGTNFDPYDASHDDGALNGLSDDPRLDALFPEHPLTFIRAVLASLSSSLEFSAESPVLNSVPNTSEPSAGPRQLLSNAVLREIYWQAGLNDRLKPAIEEELRALDPRGTATDAETGRMLLMLGIVQQCSNNSLMARKTLERGVKIFEQASGAAHRDTGVALVHLGRVLLEIGKPNEARAMAERAIAILDKDPASADLHLVAALTTQCQAMEQKGLLSEAAPILQRLVVLQSKLGPGLRPLHELAGGPASELRGEIKIVRPGNK